jgi:hypothetical protein
VGSKARWKQSEPALQTTKEDKPLKTPAGNENGKHRKTQIAQGLFLRFMEFSNLLNRHVHAKTDYLDRTESTLILWSFIDIRCSYFLFSRSVLFSV